MAPRPPEVPTVVRSKAIAHGAGWWLDALAPLVETLEDEWSISVGDPFDGGTEAYVAPATLDDGTDAVLKLIVPRAGDAARHEIAVLAAAGDACVDLLRSDVERGALLLERLGPSLNDLGLPHAEREPVLADLCRRFWRPAPTDLELPTGAEKADWLIDHVVTSWEELDRPCSERTIAHAVDAAHRRRAAHDAERAVLVHGDVHEWNALRVPGTDAYRVIDPDGLVAEPEYDLGVLLREDPLELVADGDPTLRARRLAAVTGCDPVAVAEWGAIERVSTGLLCVRIGLEPVGSQMLAAADWVSDVTR